METLNITKRKFESLKKYNLPNYVYNTEGVLYILPTKNGWNKQNKLLKRLYLNSGTTFGNKLQTINSLIDHKEEIAIEDIIFPEKIATVNSEIVGFTMPLINSVNLTTVLKSDDIPNEQKIKYLKQIGAILEEMKKVREYTEIKDFYLNDLHESNFIIDTKEDKVKVIDIDSCKILGNGIFSSKYLSSKSFINNIYKYHKSTEETSKYNKYNLDSEGSFIPDENTDLYCYIIVILNFLYKDNIQNFTLQEFYDYLDYLNKIGIDIELLSYFEKIAIATPNENPYELLDNLNPYVIKSNHHVYTHIKNKHK